MFLDTTVLLYIIIINILVAALTNALAYSPYGSTEDSNSNRKLHHIKSHQQMTSTGHMDNNRPQIEEMPYQVLTFFFRFSLHPAGYAGDPSPA